MTRFAGARAAPLVAHHVCHAGLTDELRDGDFAPRITVASALLYDKYRFRYFAPDRPPNILLGRKAPPRAIRNMPKCILVMPFDHAERDSPNLAGSVHPEATHAVS